MNETLKKEIKNHHCLAGLLLNPGCHIAMAPNIAAAIHQVVGGGKQAENRC